jgi:hypothetical protein
MPKHRSVYWKEIEIVKALSSQAPLDFIWSVQFQRVAPGDTLWILGILDNRFGCLGYVQVAAVKAGEQGRFNAIAKAPVFPRFVDLTAEWKQHLTFDSPMPILKDLDRRVPNGQSLQTVRVLSSAAVEWLKSRWGNADES